MSPPRMIEHPGSSGPRPRGPGPWRAYALAALVSLVAAVVFLQLWKANLRVPFDYGGDALSFELVVKSMVDHGWYLDNPDVGAPFGLQLHDFPFADSLHLLVIKVMSVFSHDWALLFNLYFLLGFPLITVAALAVFRHFRLPYVPALVASVLYAFLPSRLLKGENHIFMDVFFQVPLAILVVLWVCSDQPPLTRERADRWPAIDLRGGRSVAALVICAATACLGLYYAFFTAFLLVAGGLWAALRRRSLRPLVAGAALAGVIAAGLAVNGLPTVLYRMRHGPNRQVATRIASEAELYALKPMQLVLPVDGHRIPALARLKDHYLHAPPFLGEEGTSLGAMGTVGFLALVGLALLGKYRDHPRGELLRVLGALNLFMLILGTVGGLGSWFAMAVTPQIRTYARVNVVIGFLALFALALLLEPLALRRRGAACVLAVGLLVLGLFDQVSVHAIRPYAAVKVAYDSDAQFVRRIEAAVPAGSMIFQLPQPSFPEGAALHGMGSYDPVRPYLHSRSLRWSQPAMRGRPGDAWLATVLARPPRALVETVSDAGFAGILVNRQGYADGGAQIEKDLRSLLGVDPVVSPTGLVFFDLASFNRAAHAGLTAEARERRRDRALHPVLFVWQRGFSGPETLPGLTWRWCSGNGELAVDNEALTPRQISIRMTAIAGRPPATLELGGDLTSLRLPLDRTPVPIALSLEVPPGHHVIKFHSDGKPIEAPNDPRTMVWRAENPLLEEAP